MYRAVVSWMFVSILLTTALSAASAQAAVLTYDADTGAAGAQDGAGAGWDTTNASFWDGAANVVWPAAGTDEAVFGAGSGTAGTVAVGTISAGAITFNTPGSGAYTLSGGAITLDGTAPTIAANVNATIVSDLAGTGGLTKSGAGVLTLSGTLAYTGDTVVDGGTLVLNKGGTLGGGNTGQFSSSGHTITVNDGAVLRMTQSWAMGDGQQHHLVANGGTIEFSNSDNYQSSIELTGGAIVTSGGNRPWRVGNYDDATITVNASDMSSTISGSLCLVKTANADLITFDVADGGAEDDLLVSSTIYDHPPAGATNYGGTILAKDGLGKMVLSGANTYVGKTRIDGGTLAISADNNLGAAPASATVGHLAIAEGAMLAVTGSFTLNANRGLTVGGTLDVAVGQTLTYNGIAAGAGGLTKTGGGTLALGGANTYAGATVIDGGTLVISADNNLGAAPASATVGHLAIAEGAMLAVTGSFTLNANRGLTVGGTLDVADSQTLTYNGIAAGAGGLTKTGGGTLALGGANTYAGATVIDGGTLVISADNNLGAAPASATADHLMIAEGATLAVTSGFTLNANRGLTVGGTLDVADGQTLTYNGTVTGAGTGGLTKAGGGTLTLGGSGGNVTVGSGGVTVSGGTLRLARSSVPFDAGVFATTTPLTIENGATLEVAGMWNTGSANAITVNGGTLNFTNGSGPDSENYANNMNLANAIVTGNGIRIGNDSNAQFTVTGDAGTTVDNALMLVNSGGSARTLTLDVADGAADNDMILSGVLYDFTDRGNNRIAKTGAGTLLVTGDNTFTGTVAVDGGLLVMGHQNALGAATNALALGDVAGATLSLGSYDLNIGSLTGGGTTGGEVALGANTLTVGAAGASSTYAGTISGTGNLTKAGAGTLTLSGVLNHTGDTIVDGGTLILNGGGGLADGNLGQFGSQHTITVNSGATLAMTASWALGDGKQHTLVADGGTIDFGTAQNYQNSITLTGAKVVTATGGKPWRTGYYGGSALITVNESDVSSTISGLLCFVKAFSGGPGTTTFDVADGTAELDLDVSSVIFDHDASLSGMVLVKDGPGAMSLSGANTFAGGVNVNAGTLLVNNTTGSGTGTGAVNVSSGATLGGTGTIGGATTIAGGATLATGASVGTLTFDSDLTLQDGATWDWEFVTNTAGEYDQAVGSTLVLPAEGSGAITLNILGLDGYSLEAGDSFTLFTGDVYLGSTLLDAGTDITSMFNISDDIGWWGDWEVTAGSLILTAVPEPGAGLILLSVLAYGLLARRRKD